MSIYKKLSNARKAFHGRKLTKSGHNKFAGYKYFELGDFVQAGMECLDAEGLVSIISFNAAEAVMTVFDTESDSSIVITSPMAEANLKGCHPIQNLGAVETYQRRYLWVTLLEIIEHDALDSSKPLEEPVKPTKAMIGKLEKAIESSGRSKEKLLEYYEASSLNELSVNQINEALAMMEKAK